MRAKVRQLILREISDLERFPNFKGATILGLCLNVLGLELRHESLFAESRPFHRDILDWVRRHFDQLHATNPEVAEACLVDGLAYDTERRRLVRTRPAGGLRTLTSVIEFPVDRGTPEPRQQDPRFATYGYVAQSRPLTHGGWLAIYERLSAPQGGRVFMGCAQDLQDAEEKAWQAYCRWAELDPEACL